MWQRGQAPLYAHTHTHTLSLSHTHTHTHTERQVWRRGQAPVYAHPWARAGLLVERRPPPPPWGGPGRARCEVRLWDATFDPPELITTLLDHLD